ncbi:MAG TPA: ATP-binding protein [Luteibacter sp.]|nr:ATP-binding protein [Luteibacter sp.]
MSAAPGSLFTRMTWLLAATAGLIVLIGLVALRTTSGAMAGDYAAHTVALQVAAADALIAERRPASELASLDVARASAPPPTRVPTLRLMREILGEIDARLPGRMARIDAIRRPTLWVTARAPAEGWIGVPLPGLRAPLLRTGVATVAIGALVVLLMAAAYARSLTAPLRRLADAAGDVVSGTPPPPLPRGSVRELVELDAALARAATDVRQRARDRDLMLAALSHDLRTPLARLRLGLELLDPGTDVSLHEGMQADIEALDALSAQFVAFARDGSEEAATELDIAALLREMVALNGHVEGWRVDAPNALFLHGKPLALRRALDNLLRNAIRHGAPPFHAILAARGGEASITIADGGPGVPPEILDRLGEPFLRGDTARGGAGGSGLGLASVSRIAAAHGGSLRLGNLTEGGFAATLRLPLAGQG